MTIRRKERVPHSLKADGNTWDYSETYKIEQVPAKVWPVAIGKGEMLVEFEDGTLHQAKLWDIKLVR